MLLLSFFLSETKLSYLPTPLATSPAPRYQCACTKNPPDPRDVCTTSGSVLSKGLEKSSVGFWKCQAATLNGQLYNYDSSNFRYTVVISDVQVGIFYWWLFTACRHLSSMWLCIYIHMHVYIYIYIYIYIHTRACVQSMDDVYIYGFICRFIHLWYCTRTVPSKQWNLRMVCVRR